MSEVARVVAGLGRLSPHAQIRNNLLRLTVQKLAVGLPFQSCHARFCIARPRRSRAVHFGRRQKIVARLALIKGDDLVHAGHARLFPVRLGNVMRRHFWIGPEHCHHLALRAVGIGCDLGARFAHAMAVLLWLIDALSRSVTRHWLSVFAVTKRTRNSIAANLHPLTRSRPD